MTDVDSTTDFDGRIAIVGMACRAPGAGSVAEFWDNVRAGRESSTELSDEELLASGVDPALLENPDYVKSGMFLENPAAFDAAFFGFSPRDARILDPQHRHFLEVCWQALEDGGYDPFDFEGSIGVFGGSGHNAYMPYNLLTNPELANEVGFFLLRHTGNDKDFLTTRVSYNFNLRGPSLNIQTACSTSLVGVHVAAQSLLNVECDMALAGGVSIMLPLRQGYLHEEGGIVSDDGHCRAFDAASTGTVISSGIGVVLLKRLDDALRDNDTIHGVILGSAINNDGVNKVNYLAPSVDGQAAAIVEALEVSDIDADTVEFIECHGTGTKIGDPIEVAALMQAYGRDNPRRNYCALGSVKSNIGHTDTAAGVLGLIKAVCSLQAQEIPPTVHFSQPNSEIDFENSPFFVNAELRGWTSDGPRRAAVSSLGVGGTNAHVILEEAPKPVERACKPRNLICLSAKTTTALEQQRLQLLRWFEQYPGTNLSDAEFTLLRGRQLMPYRASIPVSDIGSALRRLEDPQHDLWQRGNAPERRPGVVFMYAGGGAQHPGMGRDLFDSQPEFRRALEECASILRRYVDYDLLELMYPSDGDFARAAVEMEKPSRSLPSLFSMQYAQTMLWKSLGVEPDALIGHSMGENTALCVAGGMTLEEGLSLVALRGQLQEKAPRGGMLSVMASAESLESYLTDDLTIGVYNAPEMCVVSGPVKPLAELEERLTTAEIQSARVRINVAAHSRMLDPVLGEFRSHLQTFDYQQPAIPIASTFSGEWLTDAQAADPDYWTDQLRNPVKFSAAAELLLGGEERVFLEVGPSTTLKTLVGMQSSAAKRTVLASSRRATEEFNDNDVMMSALGALWCNDVDVDWSRYLNDGANGRIQLPTYPFEHQEFWVEPGTAMQGFSANAEHRKPPNEWYYQPVWMPAATPALVEHALDDVGVLVIDGGQQNGDGLTERIRAIGYEVQESNSDIGQDELVSRLDALSASGSRGIVVVYLAATDSDTISQDAILSEFKSFWTLARALTETEFAVARVAVVSSGAIQCIPGEALAGVAAASLNGMMRVLPSELPGLSVRHIDVDWPGVRGSSSNEVIADLVLADVFESTAVDFASPAQSADSSLCPFKTTCYRRGQRFSEAFAPVNEDTLGDGLPADLDGQHILISGGLGGLGLNAARLLASRNCRQLSLIGRSELPDRKEWPELQCQDSRVAGQIAAIEALERTGVSVSLLTADISDAAATNAAVALARETGGPISGVIHAAGTLDDQLLQLKSFDDARAVFEPKVLGALNLVSATREDVPDFVVFYSSVSALLGAQGQTDYAAANAFLDGYAKQLSHAGVAATSINWSVWQEIGMAADLESGRRTKGTGFAAFQPRLRNDVYEYCLDESDWPLHEHRTSDGLAVMPGTALIQLAQRAVDTKHGLQEDQCLTIRDMSLFLPLTVGRDERRLAGVRFSAGRGGDEFEILSAATPWAAAAGEWDGEHVQGRYVIDSAKSIPRLDVKALQSRMREDSDYELNGQTSSFMKFGERWNCLRRVWSGEREMLGELVMDDRFAVDLEQYPLHPALLDVAVAGLQSLHQLRSNPEKFLIPMSYGEVQIFGHLSTALFSHVVFREASASDQMEFDIDVCDVDGKQLLRVRRFVMKLGTANLLQENAADTDQDGALDIENGILPDEGNHALAQLIANPLFAQVIVSPQDFPAVFERALIVAEPVNDDVAAVTERQLSTDYVAPETPIQKTLSRIWEKGLGIDGIGIHDNFFSLGGHSLLLTQLAGRMKKELQVNPKVSRLFDNPTIAEWERIAEECGNDTANKPPSIRRVAREKFRVSSS